LLRVELGSYSDKKKLTSLLFFLKIFPKEKLEKRKQVNKEVYEENQKKTE